MKTQYDEEHVPDLELIQSPTESTLLINGQINNIL